MGLILVIDWEKVLANGITPVVVLVVVGIVAKYALWPYVKQYLDDARSARMKAQEVLEQQAATLQKRTEKLESREDQLLDKFGETLDALNATLGNSVSRQDKQIELLAEVASQTREARTDINKLREDIKRR
jgi:Tfp pilus assembly protein PilE